MLQNDNELQILPFTTGNYAIVISRSHPAINGIPEPTIQDLCSYPVNLYIPACENPTRLIERTKYIWSQVGFYPEEIILVPNVDSTLWAASMNIGVAALDDTILLPQDLSLIFLKSDVPMHLVIARRKDNEKECLNELIETIIQNTTLNFTT